MISILFAAAAAAATPACPDLLTVEAFTCKAMVAARAGDSAKAAAMFEQGAGLANAGDAQIARMLAAAGNLWIEAGDADKSAADLDKALALKELAGPQRGEALLDRARAAEAKGDLATARNNVTQAASLVPGDPFLWYFSASLAMREGNAVTAQSEIAKALALAPADATILFEAGHVAQFAGDDVGAREYWRRAVEREPNGSAGQAAREALAMLPAPLVVKSDPAPKERK